MKKIYNLFALVLALMFSSCVSDPAGPGGKDKELEGEHYISFKFNLGKKDPSTRYYDKNRGTLAEQRIDELYLLMYNADGNLKYAWKLDAATVDPTDPESAYIEEFEGGDVSSTFNDWQNFGFITVARKVNVEPYSVVVFANPGTTLRDDNIFGRNTGAVIGLSPDLASSRYRNLTELQSVLTVAGPDDLGAEYAATGAGNKFFMSNANGPVPVTESNFYETSAEAENSGNAVRVYIDRALAKIVVNEGENIRVTNGVSNIAIGEVAEFKWGIGSWNLKTYPIRQFAMISELSGNYGGEMEDYDKSVYMYENYGRHHIYATDPNMFTAAPSDFGGHDQSNLTMEWNLYDPTGQNQDNFLFATENTMDVSMQSDTGNWHQYTTHVFVNAKIKIFGFAGLVNFYSVNLGTSAAPDYRVFTWEQAKGWLADGFPSDMAGVEAVLEEIRPYVESQVAGWRVFDFFNAAAEPVYIEGTDGDYYTNSRYKPVSITGDNGVKVFYHYQGVCQYRIPLYHIYEPWDPAIGLDTYAHLGVVRNNVYTVSIERIYGPGTDGDLAYISARVTVMPWYAGRSQSEILDPYD
mgnify:CR=1 FL=1